MASPDGHHEASRVALGWLDHSDDHAPFESTTMRLDSAITSLELGGRRTGPRSPRRACLAHEAGRSRTWRPRRCPASARRAGCTFGLVRRPLAMTTFCWLPPDRDPMVGVGARDLDSQVLDLLVDGIPLCPAADQHKPLRYLRRLASTCCGPPSASARGHPLRSSGTSASAGVDAVGDAAPSSVSPSDLPSLAPRALEPASDLHELGAPRTHEPVQAQDLAGAQLEIECRGRAGVAALRARRRHVTPAGASARLSRPCREGRGQRSAAERPTICVDDPGHVDLGRLRVGHECDRRAGR